MPRFPYTLHRSNACILVSDKRSNSNIDMISDAEDQHRQDDRPSRPWLKACGWLLFLLGILGIFLPVMPTTVFWIGAVWCWSRSAPHLTHRILSHPRFGAPVQRFIEHGEMTRQGKLAAIGGMGLGFLLLQLFSQPVWSLSLFIAGLLIAVGTWLWFRPEPRDVSPTASAD